MRHFTVSALAAASLALLVLGAASRSPIGYQIHSVNDLRAWDQLLRKGARWFKIDAHYALQKTCKQRLLIDEPRGCVMLTHDAPFLLATSPFEHMDTAADLLEFLRSDLASRYFVGQRGEIAICGKFVGDVCSGSQEAADYISLMSEWFAQATKIIADRNLSISLVVDGVLTGTCLKDAFRPWDETWIPDDNPFEAMFSDDVSLGYDRFQVFNPGAKYRDPGFWIRNASTYNYGKVCTRDNIHKKSHPSQFANSGHPLQFWEPSDQEKILSAAADFLAGPDHAEGIKFAINIDPTRFEVFSAPSSLSAWNLQPVPHMEAALNPQTFSFSNDDHMSIITLFEYNGKYLYVSNKTSSMLGSTSAGQVNDLPLNFSASLNHCNKLGERQLFCSSIEGEWISFELQSSDILYSKSSGQVRIERKKADFPLEVVTVQSGSKVFAVTATPQKNSIEFQLFAIDIDSGKSSEVGEKWQLDLNFDVSVVSFAAIDADGAQGVCTSGQITVAALAQSLDDELFLKTMCISLDGKWNNVGLDWPLLTVGTSPSIALSVINDAVCIAEVHSNAFHWLGDKANKYAEVALCDQEMKKCKNLIGYTFSTLEGLSKIDSLPVSPCSLSPIYHGTVDYGKNPTIAFAPAPSTGSITTILVSLTAETAYDWCACGVSLERSGILLDGFTFPVMK